MKLQSGLNQVDYDTLEMIVLVALNDEFNKSDREFVSLLRVKDRLSDVGLNRIREALRQLVSDNFAFRKSIKRPSPGGLLGLSATLPLVDELTDEFRITRKGEAQVAAVGQLERDQILGVLIPFDAAGKGKPKIDKEAVGGPEDVWEPIKLERDAQVVKDAIVDVEAAVGVIESNNGYSVKEPAERASLLQTIKGALGSLKEGVISKAVLRSSLVATFKYLSEKFAATGIGEVAKKAFETVWRLLASL